MRRFELLLGILLLFSCERIMILDAGETPMVVVNCVLTSEPKQFLELCYTRGASEKDTKYVTDAAVKIMDVHAGEEYRFDRISEGKWSVDLCPQPGRTYKLIVEVPGYETIWAEQTMPVLNAWAERDDCVLYEHYHANTTGELRWSVEADDAPYVLFVWAMQYDEILGKRVVADYICSDGYPSEINETELVYSGSSYPELVGRKMHEKYLKFSIPSIDEIKSNPAGQGPFFVISGDFKGNFPYFMEAGSCKLKDDGHLLNPGPKDGYLVFARASEEYTKFFADVEEVILKQKSSDIRRIYERDNSYSNIHGGIGIFGAVCTVNMMWSPDHTPDGSLIIGAS